MESIEDFTEDEANPDKDMAVKRSTWVSVVVNLGLTATQVAAGLISGSQGQVASGSL